MRNPFRQTRTAPFLLASLLASLALVILLASVVSARDVPFSSKQTVCDDCAHATDVSAADVDSDGHMDIIGVSRSDGKVLWWENDGTATDGSWVAHTLTDTFTGAVSAYVADVDGDGNNDVLGAAWDSGEVVWWENDGTPGDEGWISHLITSSLGNPAWVRGDDIDADGDLDILVATWNASQDIVWWENSDSNGTSWVLHPIYDTLGAVMQAHTADVDGDGDQDVVAASYYPDMVAWWENTLGDGTVWQDHIVDDTLNSPRAAAVADVDGDGDADILAAEYGDDRVFWWENVDQAGPGTGDGTSWTRRQIDDWHQGANSIFATDLDGDGDIDALGTALIDDDVTWWENEAGDGTTWIEHLVDPSLDGLQAVYASDVDGDGDMDYLAAAGTPSDQIVWWENETIHRNATFPLKETVEDSLSVWDTHAADMDGDGDQDLLGAATVHSTPSDGWLRWWRNNDGLGTDWSEFAILDDGFDGAVAIRDGDLDGDGDLDFLAAAWQDNDVAWWENTTGDGSLMLRHDLSTDYPAAYTVDIADVDGDGDLDALAGGDNTITWWENNGTTTGWAGHTIHYEWAHNIRKLEAADVDRDGDIDVVGACYSKGYLAWWENDGTGLGWTRNDISGGLGTFKQQPSLHTADLDGDGDVDVVATHGDPEDAVDIKWFANDGSGGGWTPHTVETGFNGADGIYASDLDLDGDLDLMSASGDQFYGLAWWENTTGDGLAWSMHTVVSTFAGLNLHSADMDGDGDPDIVAAEYGQGDVVWWANQGGQFALETADTTPGGILQGEMDDMLRIKMTHSGQSTDGDEELASIELLLEETASDPLTSAEANALVEVLHVYLDDGTQIFDPAWDTLVTSVETLELSAGRQTVHLPDGDANVQVGFGVPKTFFVVPQLTANAHQQTPSQFRITHITEASSSAEDRAHDIPLVLEYAANTPSGYVALVNHPPVAVDDYPDTAEDTEVVVSVTGNDTDADDDPLTITEITQPSHGTAVISGTNQVVYTPTLNYYGDDSFDYTVSDGVLTDITTVWVTVTPVNDAPDVDAGADKSAAEGDEIDFEGAYTDPDLGDSHTVEWDFDDGHTASTLIVADHVYADDGIYVVSLTVDDGNGGVGSDTLQVTIANVAPSLEASPDLEIDYGETVTVTATFTDPGVHDVHVATIDWGDDVEEPGTVDQVLGTVSGSHLYSAPGDYTVTVTITDDDEGQGSDTLTVKVVCKVYLPLVLR